MFRSGSDMIRINKESDIDIGNELFVCDYCTAGGWSSETEVEIHKTLKHKQELKTKLDVKDNVCGICFKEFDNDKDLLKHIKTVHLYSSENAYRVERELFVCNNCCQIFFNKRHLIIHITKHHIRNSESHFLECPNCCVSVKQMRMWSHFHKHMVQSTSSCRICFIKCKTRSDLMEHLKTHGHHFKCDMCGYVSKKSSLFNQHISENHKGRDGDIKKYKQIKRYFIPQDSNLVGMGQILMIFRGVYISNGVRICVLCREICVGHSEMKRHITMDHYTPELLVKNKYCCACGEVFNNKVLLKHHVFKMKGDHKVLVR